jgi:uncharacterized membrane protein HdeD (DUF308 family)
MAQQWNEQWARAEGYPGGLAAWIAGAPLAPEEMRRARTVLFVSAALALLGGLVAIAVPIVASVTIAVFIGWVLLFGGITAAVHAVSHRAPLRGLEALITLAAGLYLLVFPLSGTVTLTFVLAVWLFASGLLSIAAAMQRAAAEGRAMALLGGGVSILLGVLIAVELPSSAAWAIGLLVGVNLLFWSVRALAAARLLGKRLGGEVSRQPPGSVSRGI